MVIFYVMHRLVDLVDLCISVVMTYMPQDFRGTIIRQQKERSERNKQAAVDALISSGGSIRDKYALLWNQQMERWDFSSVYLFTQAKKKKD